MKAKYGLLYYDEQLLKAARINRKTGLKEETVFKKLPSDIRGENLIELLKPLGVSNRNWVLALPRHLCIIRHLILPTTIDSEIELMVQYQAIRESPYSKEDIVMDYMVLQKKDDGFSRILLILVPKPVILKYLETLKDSGIKPLKLTFSTQLIAMWGSKNLNALQDQAIALIDIDKHFTEMVVLSGENIIFTRSLPIGSGLLLADSDGKWQKRFSDKIEKSIVYYRNKNLGSFLGKVYIFSPLGLALGLTALLEKKYKLPVEINSRKESESALTLEGPAALQFDKLVNLVPTSEKEKQLALKKKKEYILNALRAIASLLFLYGTFSSNMHRKQMYFSDLKKRLDVVVPRVKEIEQKYQKIKQIDARIRGRAGNLNVLIEVIRLTPENIKLTYFSCDESGEFRVYGYGKSMSEVLDYVSRLESSRYFYEVEMKNVNKRVTRDESIVDFRVSGNYKVR